MLGWEFPPLISGGLGVACHGLSKALCHLVDLTVLLPRAKSTSDNEPLKLVGFNSLTEADLGQMAELSSLPTLFQPYEPSPSPTANDNSLYGGDLFARITTYARAALNYAEENDFDLIHAHDWMTALAGLEISRATGKPLVFHIHSLLYDRAGPDERGWIYEIEKQIIAEAALIIPVSHYTRQICLTHYNGDPNKIHPVHNGVEPVTPFRSSPPFPEKIVLFLGRLTHQKSPHAFLKIAAKTLSTNPNVRFVIAGTGDQLPSLIEESLRLNIGEKVHFPGFRNRSEIHQLLSQTDVYCMPSLSEPFGLSALEAAQFGIPVVLSKQSGAAEVLPSAPSADSWDLDRMAAQIQELLTNPQAHQATSRAMFNAQKNCTWEKAAQKIHGLYLMHLKFEQISQKQ